MSNVSDFVGSPKFLVNVNLSEVSGISFWLADFTYYMNSGGNPIGLGQTDVPQAYAGAFQSDVLPFPGTNEETSPTGVFGADALTGSTVTTDLLAALNSWAEGYTWPEDWGTFQSLTIQRIDEVVTDVTPS